MILGSKLVSELRESIFTFSSLVLVEGNVELDLVFNWDILGAKVHEESTNTEGVAHNVLDKSQLGGSEYDTNSTAELDDEPLETEFKDEDDDEPFVVEEATEDVDFTPAKLSWTDLVEKIHDNKSVE